MHLGQDVITALENAAEEEKARQKGATPKDKMGRMPGPDPSGKRGEARVRRRRKLRLKAALLGRSGGGQTSKVHLAADRKCRPLVFVLTTGQAADSPQFIPVLKRIRVRGPVGRPRTRPDSIAGDRAYSYRGNWVHLRKRHIKAVIPEKKDQAANRKKKGSRGGRPVSLDAGRYKERNTVERLINKLKAWRGIATGQCLRVGPLISVADERVKEFQAGLPVAEAAVGIDVAVASDEMPLRLPIVRVRGGRRRVAVGVVVAGHRQAPARQGASGQVQER